MVKIEILMQEGKLTKIGELELDRYVNFLENSYVDNLKHCKADIGSFPRWSIISGYYAMHDVTKLLLAKKFRLNVISEVHATMIKTLKELIKNREIINLMELGYREFLSLASDLEEAKKERVRVQYYTGTKFMAEEYRKRAVEFEKNVASPYVKKMEALLKQ